MRCLLVRSRSMVVKSRHFLRVCVPVLDKKDPDVDPHVALSKRITDYNALCENLLSNPKSIGSCW